MFWSTYITFFTISITISSTLGAPLTVHEQLIEKRGACAGGTGVGPCICDDHDSFKGSPVNNQAPGHGIRHSRLNCPDNALDFVNEKDKESGDLEFVQVGSPYIIPFTS